MAQPFMTKKGNPIQFERYVARVLSLDEVRKIPYYSDLADLAEIFNHDIVACRNNDTDETWRWRKNLLVDRLLHFAPVYTPSQAEEDADNADKRRFRFASASTNFRASVDLNGLFRDLSGGCFRLEEYMKFYMQMGYSLGGFGEVFERDVREFDATAPRDLHETCIEYMCVKYKGQVLKL